MRRSPLPKRQAHKAINSRRASNARPAGGTARSADGRSACQPGKGAEATQEDEAAPEAATELESLSEFMA